MLKRSESSVRVMRRSGGSLDVEKRFFLRGRSLAAINDVLLEGKERKREREEKMMRLWCVSE
jgi:hypothetical protein